MSEAMKCKYHKEQDAIGQLFGVWLCHACAADDITTLPTPDAPQVTLPDGCAADPIPKFEGYPGIQVDAPQVERFRPEFGQTSGLSMRAVSDGDYVSHADYASLLAEKARLEGARRGFEHRANVCEPALTASDAYRIAAQARADAAEASLASLRDAVRAWKEDLRAYYEVDTDAELEALAEHWSVAERALLSCVASK